MFSNFREIFIGYEECKRWNEIDGGRSFWDFENDFCVVEEWFFLYY